MSFRIIPDPKQSWRNQRLDALQRDDGSWAVFLDGIDPEKRRGDAILRVGTSHGGATETVNLRGGGTVTIRFDKPALLKLKVERYSGSGVEGALYGAVRGKLGADGWAAVNADGTCATGGCCTAVGCCPPGAATSLFTANPAGGGASIATFASENA